MPTVVFPPSSPPYQNGVFLSPDIRQWPATTLEETPVIAEDVIIARGVVPHDAPNFVEEAPVGILIPRDLWVTRAEPDLPER